MGFTAQPWKFPITKGVQQKHSTVSLAQRIGTFQNTGQHRETASENFILKGGSSEDISL